MTPRSQKSRVLVNHDLPPPKPDIQCLEVKRHGFPEQAGEDSNTQNITDDPWDPNLGPEEICLHLEILAFLLIYELLKGIANRAGAFKISL